MLDSMKIADSCDARVQKSSGDTEQITHDGISITGRYRTIVKRKGGAVEVSEWKNTISSSLKEIVNDIFMSATDFAIDALFNAVATPPAANKDGIIFYTGSNWYSTVCSITAPSSTSTKVTGTFTGVACTISDIALGFGHPGSNTDSFDVKYADPTSWSSVVLGSDDTLIVEWTITVS